MLTYTYFGTSIKCVYIKLVDFNLLKKIFYVVIFYGNYQYHQILLSACLFVGLPLSVFVSVTFSLSSYVYLSLFCNLDYL